MSRGNAFQFLQLPREMPRRIALELRTGGDWGELHGGFDPTVAAHQAGRCLDCGNPYCASGCPVGNDIPRWLRLVEEGRVLEACELVHETNPLPEMCGRVCPQDRLCEGACTLADGFGAVTIGSVEKYIVDTAFASGWRPDLSRVVATGRHVAIVGAGPAGLACADRLLRAGVAVTVFDRYEDVGGLLRYGIPAFKLDKAAIGTRRAVLDGMGARFRLGVEIGRDVGLDALLRDHDAVFLALGAYRYTDGGLPGQDLRGVLPALPFLVHNGRIVTGADPAGRPVAGWEDQLPLPDLRGRRVVVLGGGDTGMDCVRSAVRLGAGSVHCVYRRDESAMPGSAREVANAREEGVAFLFNRQPVAIESRDGQAAAAVRLVATTRGPDDHRGRATAVPVPGSETVIDADVVIVAFGFSAEVPAWVAAAGLSPRAPLLAGAAGRFATAHPRVFAGGDCVRGADLVVTAVRDGRDAAAAIVQALTRAHAAAALDLA